jgi:hypothetical protein
MFGGLGLWLACAAIAFAQAGAGRGASSPRGSAGAEAGGQVTSAGAADGVHA